MDRPSDRYFNRELSWLSFNRRVLAEARNEDYPLLERLRFLSISGSNLDEFLMIRVAGLVGQVKRNINTTSIDGRTPRQQLIEIRQMVEELEREQQRVWEILRRLLASERIHIAAAEEVLPAETAEFLENYFTDHLLPVITPQAIDPAHPFPFVANEGIGLLFNLTRLADSAQVIEMVLIPSGLPRFVRLPGEDAIYVGIENLIVRHAHLLFPGFRVEGDGAFRVLRDSDIEIEEEAEDLVRYFRSAIQRRRRGSVIQCELEDDFDPECEALLREQLGLHKAAVLKTEGLIGIVGLADIVAEERPDLKFMPFSPRYPERVLEHDGDAFAAIGEKDIIIHHPYESFEVVVDFVRQAANDPAVVAIKQTLYRAGSQSAVIDALITAAENGKAVTAVVELKARFDEEQNLLWASKLERAGVQVIYGFVEWKTHAKISMVVRREGSSYRTYCHFGTGNYHPVTSRIYTDLSFFTADPAIGRDATRLFNFITGYVEPHTLERLAISPLGLREKLFEYIDAEMQAAREGRPCGIWTKMNQLTDGPLIDKLYEASEAGVPQVHVVRGICNLRPGIAGMSENIEVKSIIGRFLEHSRIFAFANGTKLPSSRAAVYISSADCMERNLNRRVEALVPITNSTVHTQVLQQVLLANLLDNEQSWRLLPDGTYERIEPAEGEKPFNCHDYFVHNPSLSGGGSALEDGVDVPKLALRRGALAVR